MAANHPDMHQRTLVQAVAVQLGWTYFGHETDLSSDQLVFYFYQRDRDASAIVRMSPWVTDDDLRHLTVKLRMQG